MSPSSERIARMRDDTWIAALEAFCRRHVGPSTSVVEIGCFGGESTAVFARHAGSVVAIDPWHERYESESLLGCATAWIREHVACAGIAPMAEIEALFDARVAACGNVRKIKAFDHEVVDMFEDGSVDLLYIDAIHTYDAVKATVLRWLTKLRPGGTIAGHDYSPDHWPGVVKAVHELFSGPVEVHADTSWAVPDAPDRLRAE